MIQQSEIKTIDGDGVVLPARLVEMSWLLTGLPSKSRFYRETVIILRLVKSILITSDERLTEHQFSAVHVSEQTCLFWNVSRLTSKMLLISHQLVSMHTIKMWTIAYTAPSGHDGITSLVNWENNVRHKQNT